MAALEGYCVDKRWQSVGQLFCPQASPAPPANLAGRTNAAFETLLVLGRIGLGRYHAGAALRVLDRVLASLGITFHRRLLGRLLAKALRPIAAEDEGDPAAIIVSGKRTATAASSGVVVELARYREQARPRAVGDR